MDVHNNSGAGFLEVVYKDDLKKEFKISGIPFKREKEYPVVYKEQTLIHSFYTDFVNFDRIILEAEGISSKKEEHVAQCINYLKVSGNSLALLVNFGETKLLSKRVVL